MTTLGCTGRLLRGIAHDLTTKTKANNDQRQLILFDVMDTIVVDPFFKNMPKFFGMTFDELMAAKHPTAWVEFERGQIDEQELFRTFFKDGRSFDVEGLRQMLKDSYHYIEGMETLLKQLKEAGYSLHAMSNYPIWYMYIEEKLKLSRYLDWTFISCEGPMKGLRKPAQEAYLVASQSLQVHPGQIVFVDDRSVNVDSAKASGLDGILFKNTAELERELRQRGMDF